MTRIPLLWGLLFFFSIPVHAANFDGAGKSAEKAAPESSQWRTYTPAEGLASNDINALAVEESGVLWFGSRDNGVSRFDGTSWKTYNTSNSGIVSDDFLWIEPDREGKLWFGSTWDGVSCYDGKNWINYSQVSNIRCIVVDNNNLKWFVEFGNGLTAFDDSTWTKYSSESCETAMLDRDNSIWVGYRFSGGVSNFDGKTWKRYTTQDGLVDDAVRAMAVDRDGIRWFGTAGGIASFDGQKWTTYPKTPAMPYDTVEAVAVDQNNVKWFGTYGGGGLSFDGVEWKQYNTENSGICADDIIRVLVDKSNGVWFASRTTGVSRYENYTGPFIHLTSPRGGEFWEAGSACKITWESRYISNLRIEYSLDEGVSWNLLAGDVDAAAKSYSWTLPQIQCSSCKVRLIALSDEKYIDASEGVFTISPPFIRIISPNGGEQWESGTAHPLTWSASNGISAIRIEFSLDKGANWRTIAENVSPSMGSFNWKVPNLPSPQCLVRLTDTGNSGLSDQSDGIFAIAPSLWITYTRDDGLASNDINALAVEENGTLWFGSRDNGVSRFDGSWKTYNTSNSGIVSNDFLWIEPDRKGNLWFGSTWNGVSCYDGKNWTNYSQVSNIRCIVVDNNNLKWFGEFGNGLTAFDGSTWTKYSSESCETAMLDRDNSIWVGYRFGGGVSNFNGKTWKRYTTRDGLVNDEVRAMAVDKEGVRWFGTSGGIASFDGQKWTNYPKSPNMPYDTVEAVAVDENNVKWFGTYGGGGLSFDGVDWKQYNTQNSGLCANDIIRVLVDKSNAVWFASRTNGVSRYENYNGPYVRLSYPQGGEIWESGSTREITWISKDVERIRIEYSLDGGSTWNLLAGNVDASAKSYAWTLPQAQFFSCKIRLTDVSDEKHTDTSNGVFAISPPFVQVTAPNGGERWASGRAHSITWTSLGAERVKLEYSTDGGASWQFINTVDAAPGAYAWTVPQVESTDCRVRITDAAVSEKTDTSDSAFTILPSYLRLTAPNGGESFVAEENVLISWTAAGIESSLRIDFSPNNGTNWIRVAGDVPAFDAGYIWQIPYYNSGSFLVRVSDEGDSGLSDASDGVFTVSSPLSVSERIPKEFSVSPNSPNPFNPSTTISFSLPRAERVKVDIYNLSGQRVGAALDSRMAPGVHSVVWNAEGLSAGVYLGLVRAGTDVKTIKMLFLK